MNGNGEADNTETVELQEGTTSYDLTELQGGENNEYWIQVSFENPDIEKTAEIQEINLRLGESEIPESVGNPIHRWVFKEGSGSSVEDIINDENGSIEGNTTWISDNTMAGGQALDSSSGEESFVETTTLNDFGSNIQDGVSIIFTIENYTPSSTGHRLWGTANDYDGTVFELNYHDTDPDQWRFYVGGEGNEESRYLAQLGIADGERHRVCLANDGEGGGQAFIDGEPVPTSFVNTSDVSTVNFNGPFTIFGHNSTDGNPAQFSNFIVDDVILYLDVLEAEEIEEDFENQPWS